MSLFVQSLFTPTIVTTNVGMFFSYLLFMIVSSSLHLTTLKRSLYLLKSNIIPVKHL